MVKIFGRRGVFRPRSDPAPTTNPFEMSALDGEDADEDVPFVCSTCGRTDLPEAGDWDPPICLECDAQLNFDAEELFDLGF
jgi:hypothetical protein